VRSAPREKWPGRRRKKETWMKKWVRVEKSMPSKGYFNCHLVKKPYPYPTRRGGEEGGTGNSDMYTHIEKVAEISDQKKRKRGRDERPF